MLRSAIVSLNRPQPQHRAAAGIDEQHVDAARLCLHALVEPIEIAEIGGVRLDAGGPRPDRLNGAVEFGLTATGHEDPRALRRETLGSGAADAGGAPPVTTANLSYCHDRAPAAADACSSSRPSRAAASQSTDPRPRQPRSGSTPHDAVSADPAPHRSALFWPALARQHTGLRRSARLARDRTANPVQQRAIRSFAPARTPKIRAKAIRSPASAQLPQHTPTPNPHSIRCTVGASHPAISCLGAFRTPAVRAWRWSRHAGIRKPAQQRK